MNCPSCDSKRVETTWIFHTFQYGPDENHVMLRSHIPFRTCLDCSEGWLDHIAEDIMQEMIDIHLSPMVTDDAWLVAAEQAAKRADAYNVLQVVNLMKDYKVPIDEMDEWCVQGREDFPCLFMNHIVDGLRDSPIRRQS